MLEQCLKLRDRLDRRTSARVEYEARVASKDTVLDIGGTNSQSSSNRRLRSLSSNPLSTIISTDIVAEYGPDIIDDICNSGIPSDSYDAINCCAVLEHVQDYQSAIANMKRILKPGGELFLYVPFFYCFHGTTDHHRFTVAEVDRMMATFSQHRLCVPDGNGYGGVFWQALTLWQIGYYPKIWRVLSAVVNCALMLPLGLRYVARTQRGKEGPRLSLSEYLFYYTHVLVNHGFCAWAVK